HYFCEKNTRDNPGCDFKIWGEISGKKITAKIVETLLSGGQTSELSGFVSQRNNRTFAAALKLSPEGKVEFVFRK
ncbi:topoisomerase C-terminal repeat-containing protein, partial [Burkholderia pseudomallei]|uniref:topoisomerase C-terminal repeat-containing protein n=1 Tax=Burkholderia pseudomallei TaxID=28450 RepID=UPI0021F703BA